MSFASLPPKKISSFFLSVEFRFHRMKRMMKKNNSVRKTSANRSHSAPETLEKPEKSIRYRENSLHDTMNYCLCKGFIFFFLG